jgi:RHS repeat-associated protein
MQRPNGYSMVGGWVQGVRTFDPTSGEWLTPDTYAGDVHDPMSQKPFMWNDNNPVQWSDPSGYCSSAGPGTSVCIDASIQQKTVLGIMAGDKSTIRKKQ